jgi:hypothetical protein
MVNLRFFKKLPTATRAFMLLMCWLPFGNFLKNRKLTIVLAPARCAATRRRRRARVGAVWWASGGRGEGRGGGRVAGRFQVDPSARGAVG